MKASLGLVEHSDFLPEKRQWRKVHLSLGFLFRLGDSPPAQVWSSCKTSLWSAGVYFSLHSPWTTPGLSDRLIGLLLHFVCGENSVECRPLPWMLWGPCSKVLSALTCEILQFASHGQSGQIASNYACSATLSHKSWVETYKFIFTGNLSQPLFVRSIVALKTNGRLRPKHME